MFKIFQVSIENFEFWLSQTVDFLFSLSTPFFSLLSLSFADSPPLRAQAFRHAAHAPAAALSRCLPPCSMPGLECSPARSPLTPLLPRSSAHAPGHALPPARRPRHQSRRAITAPPPGRVLCLLVGRWSGIRRRPAMAMPSDVMYGLHHDIVYRRLELVLFRCS